MKLKWNSRCCCKKFLFLAKRRVDSSTEPKVKRGRKKKCNKNSNDQTVLSLFVCFVLCLCLWKHEMKMTRRKARRRTNDRAEQTSEKYQNEYERKRTKEREKKFVDISAVDFYCLLDAVNESHYPVNAQYLQIFRRPIFRFDGFFLFEFSTFLVRFFLPPLNELIFWFRTSTDIFVRVFFSQHRNFTFTQ